LRRTRASRRPVMQVRVAATGRQRDDLDASAVELVARVEECRELGEQRLVEGHCQSHRRGRHATTRGASVAVHRLGPARDTRRRLRVKGLGHCPIGPDVALQRTRGSHGGGDRRRAGLPGPGRANAARRDRLVTPAVPTHRCLPGWRFGDRPRSLRREFGDTRRPWRPDEEREPGDDGDERHGDERVQRWNHMRSMPAPHHGANHSAIRKTGSFGLWLTGISTATTLTS
jgi:hypothetical protein